MDKLVTRIDTDEEAKTHFKRTSKIFHEVSLNIRERTSKHPSILNHVEQQGDAGKRDTHVLGLHWTTKEDQLSLEPFKQHSGAVWTKRKIFSLFATLSDPFGWTAPEHSKPNSLLDTFGKKIGHESKNYRNRRKKNGRQLLPV